VRKGGEREAEAGSVLAFPRHITEQRKSTKSRHIALSSSFPFSSFFHTFQRQERRKERRERQRESAVRVRSRQKERRHARVRVEKRGERTVRQREVQ